MSARFQNARGIGFFALTAFWRQPLFGGFAYFLLSMAIASTCGAATITIDFQDQTSNDGNPASPYTFNAPSYGLTSSLTVSFNGFNVAAYDGGAGSFSGPGYPNYDSTILMAGDPGNPTFETLTFSQPVSSVNFYVCPSGADSTQYSATSITGSLSGSTKFTYSFPLGSETGQLNDNTENNYYLVSGGTPMVDTVTFSNFADMGLAELSFNVPEPGFGFLLAPAFIVLLRRPMLRRISR